MNQIWLNSDMYDVDTLVEIFYVNVIIALDEVAPLKTILLSTISLLPKVASTTNPSKY